MKIGAAVLSSYLKPRPDRVEAGKFLAEQLLSREVPSVYIESSPCRVAEANRRAWKYLITRGDMTHGLVIQDDAILTWRFHEHIERIATLNPNNVISLYYIRKSVVAKAQAAGSHWIVTKGGVCGVGILAPLELAEDYVRWETRNVLPSYPHDDGRWTLWAMFTDHWIWVTVPSILNHDDNLKTSLGHAAHINYVAAVADAEDIDWTAGLSDPVRDTNVGLGERTKVEADRIRRMTMK